ncbi:enoyl reductase domain of FAS1 [Xylariaceae sp. FL0594]|nr:enoyl reductase domain of FAS1 [Xylariaceae sp. FL0594]
MGSEGSDSSFDELNLTPGLAETPGIYTPGKPVTVSISHQDVEQSFSLAASDAAILEEHRRSFLASLSRLDATSSLISSADLTFRFLAHLLGCDVSVGALGRLFYAVHNDIMQKQDIHEFVSELADDNIATRKAILRTFVSLQSMFQYPLPTGQSALQAIAERAKGRILLAFGGQSSSNSACVDELAELYWLYQPLVQELTVSLSTVLSALSRHPETDAYYTGREIDVLEWLANPAARPAKSFISSAAVSFPIIGLTSLLHYCVICKTLGKTPGQLADLLSATTGHSQGIVIAAAVARSDSWESFFAEAERAVMMLFWMGYESHVAAPGSPITRAAVDESVQSGYGVPTYMLSVRGMALDRLEAFVSASNKHLRAHEKLCVALVNDAKSHVVAGPPKNLHGLLSRIKETCVRDGVDQTRVPYSRRKPVVNFQYLPISAPFHSSHLREAAECVKDHMGKTFPEPATASSLRIPVFHTETGQDMQVAYESAVDVTDVLVRAVMTQTVNWSTTLQIGRADTLPSHIITLGSGRFSDLVHSNVDGYGVCVIDGTKLDTAGSSSIGAKAEIFTESVTSSTTRAGLSSASWEQRFRPRIVKASDGTYQIETRLNSILRAPPIITAGMTPTTVPWDFVAAVTRAGYHIELAGGGYRNAATMEAAISKVVANIPAGRGITCNLIYVDPKAIGYQIPLIQQLVRRGVPIEGITIGAGVPSPEVAAGYITTLGIKHISFKPGSVEAIRDVIEIAKSHPDFPVILQWTGGRGGGHHSCEDFHEPLLEMYSEIRRHPNLYLVVGSGFGDGAGIFPYLTGSWSRQFGRPAMPCDGVLLGSRMMIATDAHTSAEVKKLLIKAPGVDASEWEKSYLGADTAGAGGVLTVTSEMGQPIHKIATRGVKLWKDMDDTIFSLPKPEQKAALAKRRQEIIRRLNADFAKPWFGQNAAGEVVDVEDMTYAEGLSRLIQLMYVNRQCRWIDPTYRDLASEFAVRAIERLGSSGSDASNVDEWLKDPESLVTRLTAVCPDLASDLLHPEDVRFFIQSCKKRGRKPVNFVVALDEDFEHWFKKDSLWQSEDLDAVIDQDPQRVCILHSPVSVRYATRDDQSAKQILDEIQCDLVSLLRRVGESGDAATSTPTLQTSSPDTESIVVEHVEDAVILRTTPGPSLPSLATWVQCLASYTSSSILGLIREETLFEVSSRRSRSNPLREIFSPKSGHSLMLSNDHSKLALRDDSTGQTTVRVESRPEKRNAMRVEFIHSDASVPAGSASLVLDWEYNEHPRQLIDVTGDRDGRIKDFYARLWLSNGNGTSALSKDSQLGDQFTGSTFRLTRKLQRALHSTISHAFADASSSSPVISAGSVTPTDVIPIEAAVIASWEATMKPLLIGDMEGDILRLVHQSIEVSYVPNASPLRVGEAVDTDSSVRSITIEPSGRSVEIEARLSREGSHIATVSCKMFIKGKFSDYEKTFQEKEDPQYEVRIKDKIDELVLRDREWLSLENDEVSLVGKTLFFSTHTKTRSAGTALDATELEVRGTVEEKLWNGIRLPLGTVHLKARCPTGGNPVLDFLQRKGSIANARVPLKNPGWSGPSEVDVVAPSHTHLYAKLSGDCNPIHSSPVFAEVAELPGPIMHGMYTTAVCRKVVEDIVVPGEPERLRRFGASFLNIVLPGDKLVVRIAHVAMKNGRMIFEVVASKEVEGGEAEEEVLRGEAEIEQPATAYVFTGQGSQSVGMGMALYETSPVAKALFDDMDRHILERYGFSILRIIRENPTELTIHFRGREGQKILANYLKMQTETVTADGQRCYAPVIPDLTPDATSHTFSETRGLLYATQFAQPAILLLEKAMLEHLRSQGLVQEGAKFAGHSLGEFGALASMDSYMDFKGMMEAGVYRGMMMQFAIPRDAEGRTGYSMMATNPGRVGKHFDDRALRAVVKHISQESGELLEIVNFNVEGDQYVCAGHVRNLSVLTDTLNDVAGGKKGMIDCSSIEEFLLSTTPTQTALGRLIGQHIARSRNLPLDIELPRGRATVQLSGIDVPFHSAGLRFWIPGFRNYFHEHVHPENVRPEQLVDRYVPNVVGKPFSLEKDFIREAARITGSTILEGLAR